MIIPTSITPSSNPEMSSKVKHLNLYEQDKQSSIINQAIPA